MSLVNAFNEWETEDPAAGRLELAEVDDDFRRFLTPIAQRGPIWWCFFSTGLLHVVRHFLRYTDPRVNLAFITSALTPAERAWVESNVDYPVFHLEPRVDPKVINELQFRCSQEPFGWVDVDAFVTNHEVFFECERSVDPDVIISGPLSYGPIPLIACPFAFFNPQALRRLEERLGGVISPCSYAYRRTAHGRNVPGYLSRLVQPYHEEALQRLMTFEGPQLPFPQGGILDILEDDRLVRSHERHLHRSNGVKVDYVVYDGLMLLQLMAWATGMRVHRTRPYPGSKVVVPDLMHTGGIAYWDRLLLELRPGAAPAGLTDWSAHTDAALLTGFVKHPDSPPEYREKLSTLESYLRSWGSDLEIFHKEFTDLLARTDVDRAGHWAEALRG